MGLSGRAAAKELGITQPALVKAARTGRITREKDGTYDVHRVRKQLAQNSNALKRRKSPGHTKNGDSQASSAIVQPITVPITNDAESQSADPTLAEAQRQREWIRVERETLTLSRERRELAPIGEINAFVAGMIIRARDVLMRIAPELKDRLAQQCNPHECEKLVGGEVARALNELAEFKPSSQ